MGLLEKLGVGKGHMIRNNGFGDKLGFGGKVGVRKELLGRKGILSNHSDVLRENGFRRNGHERFSRVEFGPK